MTFINQLENLLEDKSEQTKKTYISRIVSIKKLIDYKPDDLKFIDESKKIIKFIDTDDDLKLSTKKLNYIALSVISELLNLKSKNTYHEKMMEFKNKNNTERKNNLITDEIKQHWATFDELREMYFKMPEETDDDIQNKLIIALYVLQPPLRNDYANIRLFNRMARLDAGNHMIIKKNKIELIINEHKTKEQFGSVSINYDVKTTPEIYRILNKWLDINDTKYLLIRTSTRRALTENDLSHLIPQIFEKYINKHITIQLLRQIYETELQSSKEYNEMSMNEKDEIHKKLLHGSAVAQEYKKLNAKKRNSKEKKEV